jgi:hypothetical protein
VPGECYSVNDASPFKSHPYHGYIRFPTLNPTLLGYGTPERFTPGLDRDSELGRKMPAYSLPTKKKTAWLNWLQSEERPISIDMLEEEAKIPLPDDSGQNHNLTLLYKPSKDNLSLPRPFHRTILKKRRFSFLWGYSGF